MIQKVLIANRGEIACRIIRTLDRLGIASVAVYSDADQNALHAEMATEAIYIGKSAATESYLQIDKIIAAAKQSGADAVHPGYGFLSENPAFVRALQNEQIIFIGPDAESIEAMGLKDAAKICMVEAGVPVVPGYHEEDQDENLLATKAGEIGYPVLIKARAGGGGKGMRKVENADEFSSALASAKRESMASFADDSVLIEKFVSSPRHIEMQVFGDRHGNVVHLNERDCSLQRRHQKVIEEAPAPGMTEEMRAAMGKAAVAVARAVNYVGAGTVEFIVDASDGLRADRFYFMEMNTRLQVEHPVTEAITGTDLVEWQIAVANGKPLPLEQSAIQLTGHAFEARIYAEDADNDFLPAVGELSLLSFPQNSRVDTGVRQGDAISPFYDPMIAKLIVSGESREQALLKLKVALAQTRIGGSTTNVGFLGRLCNAADFVSGQATTALIEVDHEQLQRPKVVPQNALVTAAMVHIGLLQHQSVKSSPWDALSGWRCWGISEQNVELGYKDQLFKVKARTAFPGTTTLQIDGLSIVVSDPETSQDLAQAARLNIDGSKIEVHWLVKPNEITVFCDAESWVFLLNDPLNVVKNTGTGGNTIVAPMPGNIIATVVAAGDSVSEGDILVQMEAMKMEHSLVAERSGVIAEVNVTAGEQVDAGAVLLRLKQIEEKAS